MNFIGEINEASICLLDGIAKHIKPNIHFYIGLDDALGDLMEASKMDFGVKNKTKH